MDIRSGPIVRGRRFSFAAACFWLITSAALAQLPVNERRPQSWQPMAALFQYTPEGNAELSRTPLIAIYADGSIIVRRTENEQHARTAPTYQIGRLRQNQQTELYALQTAVLRDPELEYEYQVSRDHADVITTFVFSDETDSVTIRAAGLYAGEYDLDSPEKLPATLAAYHRFLVELLFDLGALSAWHPDAYIARLVRADQPTRIVPWPAAWPSPGSAPYRLSSSYAELIVPVTSREQFWSAIPGGHSGCVVKIGGANWELECFPYYHGHESWYEKIAGAEEWTWDLGDPVCLCGPMRLFYPQQKALSMFPVALDFGDPDFQKFRLAFPGARFPEVSVSDWLTGGSRKSIRRSH